MELEFDMVRIMEWATLDSRAKTLIRFLVITQLAHTDWQAVTNSANGVYIELTLPLVRGPKGWCMANNTMVQTNYNLTILTSNRSISSSIQLLLCWLVLVPDHGTALAQRCAISL